MARVSIFYDNERKEQFFMVRGDERYARATKTILEHVSNSESVYNFNCTLNVNVLRDTGSGSIVIYDNDVVIYVIDDWESTDNGRNIVIPNLTYDTDHNFTAKYIGNKSCSPSVSNNILINVPDTNRPASRLTFANHSRSYLPTTQYEEQVYLSNDILASYNENQPIEIWIDGVKIRTVTTDSNGKADFTFTTGEPGLHTLEARYAGYEHLLPSTASFNFSSGYQINITSAPSMVVGNEEYTITAKITDFFGNLATDTNIVYIVRGGEDEYDPPLRMDYVSKGIYSKNFTTTSYQDRAHVYFSRYRSEEVHWNFVNPTSLSISMPATTVKDYETPITITTNSTVEGTPITLSGGVNRTVYTNSNGVATTHYTGTGQGGTNNPHKITAHFGDLTEFAWVKDYVQYWSMSNQDLLNFLQDYITINGTLRNLSTRFQLSRKDNLQMGMVWGLPTIEGNFDFVLELEGVYCNVPVTPGLGNNWDGGNTSYTWNMFEQVNLRTSPNSIKIAKVGRRVNYYVNNKSIGAISNQTSAKPLLVFYADTGTNCNFEFRTLKLWREG